MEEQLPIIQFKTIEDFLNETRNNRCDETCRVWLSQWQTGNHPYVSTVWKGVICQTILLNRNSKPTAIAQTSLVIGTYSTINGDPFGPDQGERKETIRQHSEPARELVANFFVENLYAAWRVAEGAIFTGLTGKTIQPAYWEKFEYIYDELKSKSEAT